MTKIEIRNRYTKALIYTHECEGNTTRQTVALAVSRGIDLSCADLQGAILSGSYLSRANLSRANLSEAKLSGVLLSGADLSDADMSHSDLSGAFLVGAYLPRANLSNAVLSNAVLSRADLTDTDMSGVALSPADLIEIRDDIWALLASAPGEVPALIDAINIGRMGGLSYQGEHLGIVETLAKIRGIDYKQFESLRPNPDRPAERFFINIRLGDTPETSQFSKLVHDWCVEWLNNMQAAFGVKS